MSEAEVLPIKYIFLDVVGFCKGRSVEAQSKVVEIINNIVLATIESRGVSEDKYILIPTGDGICVALLNVVSPYDIHILIALDILQKIHEHNLEENDSSRKFQVRIGINNNDDNIIVDINGKKNPAGIGINNAQRIMNCADGGQILIGQPVHELLGQREKYIYSFRPYIAVDKHENKIEVYQYIAEDKLGLNTDTPLDFKKDDPELTKLTAYYFAHAIKNRAFFLGLDILERDDTPVILIWFLAKDSVATSESTDVKKPVYRTYKAGNASLREQFENYLSLNRWVQKELSTFMINELYCYKKYVESISLRPYLINYDGKEKLRRECPDIWDEFGLM